MPVPFVVGSEDVIEGYIEDEVDSTIVPIDLGGGSVTIRARINKGTPRSWTGVIDPNQVVNKGKFSYPLIATDIDTAGQIEMQAVVVLSGKTFRSDIATRVIREAL